MKIAFEPKSNKSNKYIEIICDLLEERNCQLFALTDIFTNIQNFRSIKILHLNWFENLNGRFDFIKKIFLIIFLRMVGKKIVWVMHNKIPHDKTQLFFKKTIVKILMHFSASIIIHSRESEKLILEVSKKLKSKITYIPHPNYINSYERTLSLEFSLEERKETPLQTRPINLLFVGVVKPYKNIELLIDTIKFFGQDAVLTIAGNPYSSDYKQSLIDRGKGAKNIIFDFRFIPDSELVNYIYKSDLLVLPYDYASSLNSGTAILAFSNKKTIVCPEIGTILDLQDKTNVLSYSYSSTEEHSIHLKSKIAEAIELNKENQNVFTVMGEKMFAEVETYNSQKLVGDDLVKLYQKLI